MTVQRSGVSWRTIAPLIAVFFVSVLYWNHHTTGTADGAVARAHFASLRMTDGAVAEALNVSIRQTSTSPPKVTLAVTNTMDKVVTVLKWDSPLDPLVLQLGHLSITPAGAAAPLVLPKVQVRRKMPPGPDALITIQPGATSENEVELREAIVSLEKLSGGADVSCNGTWAGIWASEAADISQESLTDIGTGEGVFKGKYQSPVAKLSL